MESMQRRVISMTLLVSVLAAMTLMVSLLAGSIVREEDEEGHGRDGAAPGRRTASASQKCLVTIAA